MKTTRVISILMAALMLLGCTVAFAACGGTDGVIEVGNETLTLDLSGFAVYYGDELAKNETIGDMADEMAALLTERTGKKANACAFEKAPEGEDAPEILIGETSRKESVKALGSIKGDGFAIRVSENKIAIVGTTKIMTVYAMQYFLQNYLAKASSHKAIELPTEISADKMTSVTLASSKLCDVTFVYSANISDSKEYTGGDNGLATSGKDYRDFPCAAAEELTVELASAAKMMRTGREFKVQKDSAPVAEKEFLIGIVDRDSARACLAELNGGEYCFRVQNGQFLLTAWNEAALEKGYERVKGLLSAAVREEGEGVTVAFPDGFELRGNANEEWRVDCPKPDGLNLYNTLDTADNSLQYLYLGEGVGPDAFRAYGDKLKSEGYELLGENEIEESLFATYLNREAKLMIYVAYNAYAHQDEFGHPYEKALRIVASPTDTVAVPDMDILSPNPTYRKVTEPAITAVALEKGFVGMSYVLTLEDGRFVIFDGGKANSGTYSTEELWGVLKKLHTNIYGAEPNKQNPIRVAAWIITHSHSDHYNVTRTMMKTHGGTGEFVLEYLMGNYPSKSSVWPIYNSDIGKMTNGGAIKEMQRYCDFTYLKVHAGQRYYFANLEMEVMTTYDDLNPTRIHVQNDTNTVMRFSFKRSGAQDYTMMWLGDANREQSRFMCAMYGDYMKADLVQVAHHGNTGCENDLYHQVNASVVMFPNLVSAYKNYMDPAKRENSRRYDVDQTLIYDNTNTKYVFVSDVVDTTLPFGADNKPMMDKIYDAMGGPGVLIEYTTDVRNGGPAIKVRE